MIRWLAPLALALTLTLGLAAATANAQEPPPAEGTGEESGRPLDGYFATGMLAGGVLFLVAKSARR